MFGNSMKRTAFKRKQPALMRRTPMRKRSPKRAAYMASAKRKLALVHMGKVKLLPCVACGAPGPSDAHHCTGDGMARNDFKVLPLCRACHLFYHASKRTFEAAHGKDYEMLPIVEAMLEGEFYD